MVSQKVTVTNETGLHARPASILVSESSKFKSELTIHKGGKQANAKSLLSVLTLGVSKGTEITITAQGPDEEEAVKSLVMLAKTGFGEK